MMHDRIPYWGVVVIPSLPDRPLGHVIYLPCSSRSNHSYKTRTQVLGSSLWAALLDYVMHQCSLLITHVIPQRRHQLVISAHKCQISLLGHLRTPHVILTAFWKQIGVMN